MYHNLNWKINEKAWLKETIEFCRKGAEIDDENIFLKHMMEFQKEYDELVKTKVVVII